MNFLARTIPEIFDVLLVVPIDSRETLGIDVLSDMQNFRSQGLSAGIITLSQGSNPNRYKNSALVKAAIELGYPILGSKDMVRTSLAIIYDHALFVSRSLRGSFSAERIWALVDHGQSKSLALEELTTKCLDLCPTSPILMAVSASEQRKLFRSTSEPVGIWNFHAADADLNFDEKAQSHDWSKCQRIGFPASDGYTRSTILELKTLAGQISIGPNLVLSARISVPNTLQTPKGQPDVVLGFPFIPRQRDEFLKTLLLYVVPVSMLASRSWRVDVYACMRLGVPVALPRALEPHFEAAALYYDTDISALLAILCDRPEVVAEAVSEAHMTCQNRSYERSRDVILDLGATSFSEPASSFSLSSETDGHRYDELQVGDEAGPPRKVCFVTSNGAGMGHLTRLLAVARRLDAGIEVSFVSMSQACGVVAQYGYEFEYVPSKGDLLADGVEWNQYFNKRFMDSLQRLNPDVVVFDGTWPYQGVARAVRDYEAEFVWMRRGMWREETATTSLVRNTGFDAVIEPGDIASPYDKGATKRALDALKVEPIVVLDSEEIYDRGRAREILAVNPDEKAMLITLGAGNINKIDDDVQEVIIAVKSLPEKWRIFMTSPLIADSVDVAVGVENISVYPLARYAKAFDFVVSATGYNSYHEWMAYSIPALWIANANTITDDQIGRAQYAHDKGLGLAAGPGGSVSIREAVHQLGQDETRERFRMAMQEVAFTNGAKTAAHHISQLAINGSLS